jgi:hypothetical protein
MAKSFLIRLNNLIFIRRKLSADLFLISILLLLALIRRIINIYALRVSKALEFI